MSERSPRVLIVDDDPLQLELMQRSLQHEGFEVVTARAALGVTNLVKSFVPDVVLLDVNIPALSGDRLLLIARRFAPEGTKFLLFSACDETKLRNLAAQAGADGWMSKSTSSAQVATRIRKLLRTEQKEAAVK